jgi:hypothetical protein
VVLRVKSLSYLNQKCEGVAFSFADVLELPLRSGAVAEAAIPTGGY